MGNERELFKKQKKVGKKCEKNKKSNERKPLILMYLISERQANDLGGELPEPSGPWATRRSLRMFHKGLVSSKDPRGTTIKTVLYYLPCLNDNTPNSMHGDTEGSYSLGTHTAIYNTS